MKCLTQPAEQTTSDPLIARMYTDSRGEQVCLEMAILSQDAHLKACLTRLQDTAEYLTEQARQADALAHHSSVGLEQQCTEIEQAVAAVNRMTATTQEVVNNVQLTASAAQRANELTSRGRDIAAETRDIIQRLSESVGKIGATMSRLAQDSNEIGGAVGVIKGIADQINLFTLDAIVGAARVGGQGRGFAAVIGEVRSLTQRTAVSTEQIHRLTAKLQDIANDVVYIMESGLQQAEARTQRVPEVDSTLVSISEAVSNITKVTIQIAIATEEQSAVVEEINRNTSTIAALAEQTFDEALCTAELSEELTTIAQSQYSLVERFNR